MARFHRGLSGIRHVTALWDAESRYLRLPGGTCADGWEPIEKGEVCQVAAGALGLPATKPPKNRSTKRPSGCYFSPNSDGNGGTLWMNNHSATAGADFLATSGWVPETICARRGAQKTTPPPAEAVANVKVCQYVVSRDGEVACPAKAVPLNESECREMPYHFGGMLHVPFATSSAADPAGCFFFGAHYYFNRDAAGKGRAQRKVYCKSCQEVPVVSHFGDWSEWANGSPQQLALARKASARFRKLSVGKCSDIGWHPIHEKAACEEAARYLALPDIEAAVNKFAERPEGCYYFRNYADGTETLWVTVNPAARGKGAETSNLAGGGLRQPICAKQSTAGSAAGFDMVGEDRKMTLVTDNVPAKEPYRTISVGRCMDIKWQPILEADVCQAAAKQLGLVDLTPTALERANYPEGCYYFRNSEDLTATLWINTSPMSRGNGAQASSSPHGLRQPLCKNPAVKAASSHPDPLGGQHLGGHGSSAGGLAGASSPVMREQSLLREADRRGMPAKAKVRSGTAEAEVLATSKADSLGGHLADGSATFEPAG